MSIWSSEEAEQATRGYSTAEWAGNQICIDTRKINAGDIFIALKGTNNDGHDFIDLAAQKSAAVAIVNHIIPNATIPQLVVKDTLQALYDLASFKRKRSNAKFIAITGSVGKTSTKQMLHYAFAAIGKTFSSRENFNNKLGLSINLASMPNDCEYSILELGMDRSGEMHELSRIAKPNLAIITNIAPCHIENFENLKDIAYAKAEIFDYMNQNAPVILNRDSSYSNILQQQAEAKDLKIHWCGSNETNNITKITHHNISSSVHINLENISYNYDLTISFNHLIENSIFAAIAINILAKDKISLALSNLINFQPISGRGNLIQTKHNNLSLSVIDDSYNASPLSMKAALENFGNFKQRKIAILGDMLALGKDSIKYHQELKNHIINNHIDHVILCGNYMSHLAKILPKNILIIHKNTPDEIIKEIDKYIKKDDIILLKASRGVNLTKIFYYLSGNKI